MIGFLWNDISLYREKGVYMTHVKGGLTALREILESLPISERKVAKYILDDTDKAVLLTAKELGEKSQTSSTAVMRLCKSLGFSGLQELKVRVAADIQTNLDMTGYLDILPNEPYSDIINKMTANTIHTLKETADMMLISDIKAAVDSLRKATSVIFIGFGASFIAAQDGEQKLTRINKRVNCYPDVHMAATAIATKKATDVIVGISFTGETNEVIQLMQLAKARQVQTISITKYGHSTVAGLSDIRLYTSASKEATFRSGATSSRIGQLHMVDILYTCLVSTEYEQTIKKLDKTKQAIDFIQMK